MGLVGRQICIPEYSELACDLELALLLSGNTSDVGPVLSAYPAEVSLPVRQRRRTVT